MTGTFVFNDERSTIVDYPCLYPGMSLLSILSKPRKSYNDIHIEDLYEHGVWIVLLILFTLIISVNLLIAKTNSTANVRYFEIILDYLSLIFGQGNLDKY